MKVFYILYFTIISFVYGHSSPFIKRQAVASQQCASRDQTVSICSPAPGDVWYNGTYQQLTWKYNNPVFNNFTTLSFYILQLHGDQYKEIKKINVEHALGVQVVQIDDSWYPSLLPPNSPNVSLTVHAYLVGDSTDVFQELGNSLSFFPRPTQFTLIENAHNTTNSTTSPLPSNEATNYSNIPSDSQSSSFPSWAIAVIVVVVVLIIAAALALFWLLRNIRRNRQQQQQAGALVLPDSDSSNVNNALLSQNHNNHPSSPHMSQENIIHNNIINNNNNSNNTMRNKGLINQMQQIETRNISSSIHSSTPMVQQPIHRNGGGSPTAPSPTSIERSPSITTNMTSTTNTTSPTHILHHGNNDHSHQTNPILSSTDAIMIADTFRQLMRKPDWNEHPTEEITSESSLLKDNSKKMDDDDASR